MKSLHSHIRFWARWRTSTLHYIVMFLDLSCCRNRHAWNINGSFHFGATHAHTHTWMLSISCCVQQTVVHTEWAAEWLDNSDTAHADEDFCAAVVLNVTGDKLYHISCAISESTLKSHSVHTSKSFTTNICVYTQSRSHVLTTCCGNVFLSQPLISLQQRSQSQLTLTQF